MMLDRRREEVRREEVACWVTMDHYHKLLLQHTKGTKDMRRICTDWCRVWSRANFIFQLLL